MSEQIMRFVASIFKGTTLNKKMRLDHESLSHPETRIFKWSGYRAKPVNALVYIRLHFNRGIIEKIQPFIKTKYPFTKR
jgi:hypothetical protein